MSLAPFPDIVRLAPTATKVPSDGADRVIVCGSHGGAYAGYLVAKSRAKAMILNDAAGGLDDAGFGSLELAQSMDMAAATVSHASARIGDAEDMWIRGVISKANHCATRVGVEVGMACKDAVRCLIEAPSPTASAPVYEEARVDIKTTSVGLNVACVDSVSLVHDGDAGHIVVSGSHGGLVAGQHGLAIRVPAAFALYNDAGVGIDNAGISRLNKLDSMKVAAATVDAFSARIGDAMSMWERGVISYVNVLAKGYGIAPGMSVQEACELVVPK